MITAVICTIVASFVGNDENVKGKIVDTETNNPISYAHIIIENTHIGTITNEEGKFSLFISNNYLNSNLIITHVGYEKLIISPKEVSPFLNIQLRPVAITLDEVTISSLNPFEIIKEANNRRKENYPFSPSRLTGFYRHGIKVDGIYTQFLEASLEIIFPHYGLITNQSKVDREVYVNELRVFENINFYSVSPYRMFDDLFFVFAPEETYAAEIMTEKTNNQEIAIKATPKILTSGLPGFELIIDRESYAFKDVTYYIPTEFWETRGYTERTIQTKEGKKMIKERRTLARIQYSFYNHKNKWYLKQVNQLSKFAILDGSESKDVVYFINYVTQNVNESVSGLSKKNFLEKDQNIYSLKRKNNNSFWKSFPIIEPSPEQLEIINIITESENKR